MLEAVLHRCIEEGLVEVKALAVDAGLIRTDANRQPGIGGEPWIVGEDDPCEIELDVSATDEMAAFWTHRWGS